MCFFRSGHVEMTRDTVPASADRADLDAGSGLWPTSCAVAEPSPQAEEQVTELVQQAVSP